MTMTNTRPFALICWLLWGTLLIAASVGSMSWPLTGVLAASIYALWHLYRRVTL